MSEFLLEIFSEEIPAGFQPLAQAQLVHTFEVKLKKQNLSFDHIHAFGTPRRLGLVIRGLPSIQEDRQEERRGPRVNAPLSAIEGFLKSIDKKRHECEEKDIDGKGPFLFSTVHKHGLPTRDLLGKIIKDVLESFEWPKSMRWKTDSFFWARPLHSILALFEGQLVPFHLEHLNITSCKHTFGHRFLSPHKINVKNYGDYKLQLAENYVQIDPLERQCSIQEQIKPLLSQKDLSFEDDKGLLEETANLVEWPVVLRGCIEERFTELPEEVLITSMRTHQRYFATRTQQGTLAPYFLIVSNMETADQGTQIIEGNERVLRARLSDAHFFWDQDMKRPLLQWAQGLKNRIFQEKLGTLADKTERMHQTSLLLQPHLPQINRQDAQEAIALLKADLSTGMVGEFPELQGIMGGYYAKAQGVKAEIAQAIQEHYAPLGPQDQCPSAPLSIHVSLVDKIDTLVGFFAVGLEPTSSKDPYALRRTALGIIRLIYENELSVSIDNLIRCALEPYSFAETEKKKATQKVKDFIQDRLVGYLKPLYSTPLLNAVMGQEWNGFITDVNRKLDALKTFLESPEGEDFLIVYKRASNLLKQANFSESPKVISSLLNTEEQNLFGAIQHTDKTLGVALSGTDPDYDRAIQAICLLKAPLEVFFANVMVQDENAALRHNRLSLLKRIEAACSQICNLEKL